LFIIDLINNLIYLISGLSNKDPPDFKFTYGIGDKPEANVNVTGKATKGNNGGGQVSGRHQNPPQNKDIWTKPPHALSLKLKVPDYLALYTNVPYDMPPLMLGRSNGGITFRDFCCGSSGCENCGCLDHKDDTCRTLNCG
jgi:hypothetical protein